MLLTLLAQTTDYSAADAAAATVPAVMVPTIGIGRMIPWFVFWIVAFILCLIALIDVIRRISANSNDKVLWLILVIVLLFLSVTLYFNTITILTLSGIQWV